jgi:hypothetical protein
VMVTEAEHAMPVAIAVAVVPSMSKFPYPS